MPGKEKGISADTLLFNTILVFWLAVVVTIFISLNNIGIFFVILFGCLVMSMIIAYNLGTVPGLLFSLLFVFIYGSYLLYGVFIAGFISEVKYNFISWLILVPAGSFICGQFSEQVSILQEKNENYEAMHKLVTIDQLTEFLNAKGFSQKLENEFARNKRYNTVVSVIVIKINNLSEIRAIYGKKGLENVIKAVASNIDNNLRAVDVKAIIEPGTFAVILPETSMEGAGTVVEKLHRCLERVTVTVEGKQKVMRLKISIGAAEKRDEDEDILTIYDRAKEETYFDR